MLPEVVKDSSYVVKPLIDSKEDVFPTLKKPKTWMRRKVQEVGLTWDAYHTGRQGGAGCGREPSR